MESNYVDEFYVHQLNPIQENEGHKIFWDVKIQTYHPILDRNSYLVLINEIKITSHRVHFAVSPNHKVKKKERKNIDIYLDLSRDLKNCRE